MTHANQEPHNEEENDPSRMESAPLAGDPSGGREIRSENSASQTSDAEGPGRERPPEVEYHERSRPTAGIPGTRKIDPSETLLSAFLSGDFERAYAAAMELRDAYQEALQEASKQRFRANFGSDFCANCTGLHAGPGVIATCYQVQRCDYTNFREDSVDIRSKRVITNLLKPK